MARRKKNKQVYFYECSLTGEKYKVTKEVNNSEELVSLGAFYEMNPELDDRPENVKQEIIKKETQAASPNTWDELVALSKGISTDDSESDAEKPKTEKDNDKNS